MTKQSTSTAVPVRFVHETHHEVAQKVLDILKEKMVRHGFARLVGDEDYDGLGQVYVSRYCNGREQGFSVCINHRDWEARMDKEAEREQPLKGARRMKTAYAFQVAFAENRNSDDVVVYYGTWADFEPYSSTPRDSIYQHRTLHRTPNQAASAIVAFFKKHLAR